jgi:hypothetical protein
MLRKRKISTGIREKRSLADCAIDTGEQMAITTALFPAVVAKIVVMPPIF